MKPLQTMGLWAFAGATACGRDSLVPIGVLAPVTAGNHPLHTYPRMLLVPSILQMRPTATHDHFAIRMVYGASKTLSRVKLDVTPPSSVQSALLTPAHCPLTPSIPADLGTFNGYRKAIIALREIRGRGRPYNITEKGKYHRNMAADTTLP